MHKNSRHYEDKTRAFKNEHIVRDMRDEGMRPLLDRIYEVTAGQCMDYWDLVNLNSVLQTYVNYNKSEDVLELKPNFCGISLNLKAFWRRILKYVKSMTFGHFEKS